MKTTDGQYRKGDRIRYVSGRSQYLGTIYMFHPTKPSVIVSDSTAPGGGAFVVHKTAILRVEEPVLTEKERAALVKIAGYTSGVSPSRKMVGVHGSVLTALIRRGLVEEMAEGIGGKTRSYRLTKDGKRVARGAEG